MINAMLRAIDRYINNPITLSIELTEEFLSMGLKRGKNYTLSSGVSKIAVILNDDDCVYKIPFSSLRDKTEINSCEREVTLWDKARENGLENIFIKTNRIIKDKIYSQKKVYPCLSKGNNDNYYVSNYIDKAPDYPFLLEIENNLWIKDFLKRYGERKWWEFYDFVCHNTNDISNDNIGYDYEWNPIVFDYAGIGVE